MGKVHDPIRKDGIILGIRAGSAVTRNQPKVCWTITRISQIDRWFQRTSGRIFSPGSRMTYAFGTTARNDIFRTFSGSIAILVVIGGCSTIDQTLKVRIARGLVGIDERQITGL